MHEDYGINEEIARNYAFSLITVLKDQTDPNKANALLDELKTLKSEGKNLVITGDYNIAHHPIDVYNPKNCEGKSGYLPEERAWLDELEDAGFIDTFRMFDEGEENFTWWSYRTRARERNAGWRLDYFYVNEEIKDNVKSATILNEIYGSDHCPVTLELDFNNEG